MGGWDSHTNQVLPNGATSNNLRALDAALDALRNGLQADGLWSRTAVLVATEFGRQVEMNGNQGTDHGSGGAALPAWRDHMTTTKLLGIAGSLRRTSTARGRGRSTRAICFLRTRFDATAPATERHAGLRRDCSTHTPAAKAA